MKQTQCMICRSERLHTFLDLGLQPNGNCFPDEESKVSELTYPFSMSVCEECWLVQLDDYPPPELLFTDHPYVTGLNVPIVRHFEKLSRHIIEKLDVPAHSLIIDIGANDGTFLDTFRTLGMRTLGVDPGQRTGKLAKDRDITICETFWNQETGRALRSLEIRPSVITATAVFYHVPDLHDFVRGLVEVMDDQAVFVTQCVYLKNVIESVQFDHFYHEHTCVHLIRPLRELFSRYGLRMLDVEFNDVHGGSFVLYVAKDSHPLPTSDQIAKAIEAEDRADLFRLDTYESFAEKVDENSRNLVSLLTHLSEQGKTVYGLGAPVKGSTLMNYGGIGPELVSLAVEVNQFKIGRLTPGTHIPVIDEREVESEPDYYLVLAWNFLDHFIQKYETFLSRGGKFIVPNPQVRVVDASGSRNWSGELEVQEER
jgi:hypothetical protein